MRPSRLYYCRLGLVELLLAAPVATSPLLQALLSSRMMAV